MRTDEDADAVLSNVPGPKPPMKMSVVPLPVIALPRFIVVTQYADSVDDQGQSILEKVAAPGKRGRKAPHHHLNKGHLGNRVSFVQHQGGFHVGENNKSGGCCQAKRDGRGFMRLP